jgi:hypothetical protein
VLQFMCRGCIEILRMRSQRMKMGLITRDYASAHEKWRREGGVLRPVLCPMRPPAHVIRWPAGAACQSMNSEGMST